MIGNKSVSNSVGQAGVRLRVHEYIGIQGVTSVNVGILESNLPKEQFQTAL